MLPASIQVCPIELPGRGRRRGEQGIATVDQLADALVDGLPLQVKRVQS
jgi:surfactin synthase thioesterase subunit